ncbi:MAG TPA: hypothetical protein VE972_11285 [Conexibacter sp.]|nr:hypothetical protein [Conexibacter sp.]
MSGNKLARALLGTCVAVATLAVFTDSAAALRKLTVFAPLSSVGVGSNVSFEEESAFLRTVCSGVTLTYRFATFWEKFPGSSAGTMTEGATTGCRAFGFVGATVTFEVTRERPFRLGYQSILGTLPTITGILTLAEGVRFTIVAGGRTCRYEGRLGFLLPVTRGTFEGGSFLATPKSRILAGSTRECPAEGSFRGSLRFETASEVRLT